MADQGSRAAALTPDGVPAETAPGTRLGRRLRFVIPALVFIGLAIGLGIGLTKDPSRVPSALIDQPVPEFDLPPVEGRTLGLASTDLGKGKASLVNIFASWCGPCRIEHPLWMKLSEEGEVSIHGLNYKDRPEDVNKWLNQLGDPYQRTGADIDGRVSIDWGVYGVPETFVVDSTGRIRYRHIGVMTREDLEEAILPMMERISP